MALCYHGIAKGQNFKNGGLPVGFEHEFHLITQNLIKNNKDCKFDIFLHSWSLDYKDEVIEKLKPLDYIFEKPKEFKKPSLLKILKENIKKALGKGYEINRVNNIYSRWYSFKKVCEMVKKSNNTYDLVIVTRFDMCLLTKFNLSEIDANNFYSGDWITYYNGDLELLEEDYDESNSDLQIVSKGYPYDEEGLQDFFFISSQKYMTSKFSNIYDDLENLLRSYGLSNHSIAFGKLKNDSMLSKHKRVLVYSKDYFLSRWI